jgi:hypothetical protein
MLSAVRDRVRKAVDAKRTLADVLAAKPPAEFDARHGKGFIKAEQFVEIVYRSLSGGAAAAAPH